MQRLNLLQQQTNYKLDSLSTVNGIRFFFQATTCGQFPTLLARPDAPASVPFCTIIVMVSEANHMFVLVSCPYVRIY